MSDRETDRLPMTETALDALLDAAARRQPDPLPERLRARLLAEALREMPAPALAAPRRVEGAGARLARLWRLLGGVPGMAGMSAAGLAGLWIGVAPPEPVAGISSAFWQGAGLISPELAGWSDDDPLGFDDDPLLALLADD
jgi:hypothetical protein